MTWLGALTLSAGVLILGAILYGWLFRLLARVAARTNTQLDDLLFGRMRLPAKALIVLVAIHTLLATRELELPGLRSAVTAIELLVLAYLVVETAETFFFQWWLEERKSVPVPAVIRHLVLVVVYTAVVLSVLGTVTGLNLVPVLATSTVVTVVVGLALQDTLGNLFSGLALHIERPFTLGDWVLVDTVEGVVTYTGWRSTHLRTLSGDIVTFPNSVIARARVQNYSAPERRTSRRVELLVPLHASPAAVEAALSRALATVPAVHPEPPPRIWLVGASPLAQRYALRVWIDDFAMHDDIESDVQKAAWNALSEAGLSLPAAGVGVAVDAAEEIVVSAQVSSRRA